MTAALLLVALILFIVAAILSRPNVANMLLCIGLAFLSAGLGAAQLLGLG